MRCIVFLFVTVCLATSCSTTRSTLHTQHSTLHTQHSTDTVFVDRYVERVIRESLLVNSAVRDSTATVVDSTGRVLRTDHFRKERVESNSSRESELRDSLRLLRLQYDVLMSSVADKVEVPVPVERKLAGLERFFMTVGMIVCMIVCIILAWAALMCGGGIIYRWRKK